MSESTKEQINETEVVEMSAKTEVASTTGDEAVIEKVSFGAKIGQGFKKFGTNTANKFKDFGKNTSNGFKDFGHGWCNFWKGVASRSFKENMKLLWEDMKRQKGWLWLIPLVILLAIFTFWPILNTLVSAFKENYMGLSGESDGIGFGNFSTVVKNQFFTQSLLNTIIFAFISVPVSTVLALLISVALSSIKWFQKAYQSIFFLPYLTNALSIGAVFAVMFSVSGTKRQLMSGTANWGLVNTIFGLEKYWVNIKPTLWSARFVVLTYEVWAGLPFKILILFGALQNVNKQYYDAAKVDGANKWTTLIKITVPLISPMLAYLIITGFIGGFKSYTAIVGIFGPNMGYTNAGFEMGTIVGLIYKYINTGETGIACAASLILFVLIMIFTFINMLAGKKRVHY